MILCADDYGLSEDIDRAILQLCDCGKLTSVSCMAAEERCSPEVMGKLRAREAQLDLGLHLYLAGECRPHPAPGGLQRPSFKGLLWAALTQRVEPEEVERQIRSQYETFLSKCGRRPDYLDGHLHVHQFPRVRDALKDFALHLPAGERPYVRNTAMSLNALHRRGLPWTKALFIGLFGARMRTLLRRAGIRTNDGFAGIYNFTKSQRYCDFLENFVGCLAAPNGILVVHPGEVEEWRRNEYSALLKFNFAPGSLNRFQNPPVKLSPSHGSADRATSAMPFPR